VSNRIWLSDAGELVCETAGCAGEEAAKTMSIVTDPSMAVVASGNRHTIFTEDDMRSLGSFLVGHDGRWLRCLCGRVEYDVHERLLVVDGT
jgi:hypothetical protein